MPSGKTKDGNKAKSINMLMYQTSERKNITFKKNERIMKRVAVNCYINKERNTIINGVDGSAECDYDICNYTCAGPKPTKNDYTSYNLLYTKHINEIIMNQITNIFKN